MLSWLQFSYVNSRVICLVGFWVTCQNVIDVLPLYVSQHKKPVTTMLTYPWKCTVLHCNHLGNTWKPLVLMTRHFDYCLSASSMMPYIIYRISLFERRLSSQRLVSNELWVKRGHYDHERFKKWVSNERRVQMSSGGIEILKLMSARLGKYGNAYNFIWGEQLQFILGNEEKSLWNSSASKHT